MKLKKLWIVLLIVGIIILAIPAIFGIYNSINGFSGLCFWQCEYYYGFSAFTDSILFYSYIFWPTYFVGMVLIILSSIKLKKQKN